MKKIEAIIFDMDGTLYSFDDRDESHFTSSEFGKQIRANCIRFFQERFAVDAPTAETLYEELNTRYRGEVSLGLEKERGISRKEYFAFTWDLAVADFIREDQELAKLLGSLTVKCGLLTAAPRVWAERVLTFLQVQSIFGEAIFTGDPDLRKPDPKAFQQLANFWGLEPAQILSIGDQETSDILPPKSLGMKTLRIAKKVESQADFVAPDLITAITLLQQEGII